MSYPTQWSSFNHYSQIFPNNPQINHGRGSFNVIHFKNHKSLGYNRIREAWEAELGQTFDDSWWDAALSTFHTSSTCARLTLIQFKVLFRIHYSKAKLSRIYPNVTDSCDRCHSSPCNLTHMFYSCPLLVNLWKNYFDAMSKVFSIPVNISPHTAIFGVPEDYARFTSKQLEVLAFTSLIVRRLILLQWKSTKPPSSTQWLSEVMSFLKLERIRYSTRGNLTTFPKKWDPFLTYFNSI